MGKTPPGQTRRKVYAFVCARIAEGRPPTVREVQQAFSFKAVQSAREHLEGLVTEGLLLKEAGIARGLRLPTPTPNSPNVARQPPTQTIPLLGRVQAGAPTTALEEPLGYLTVHSRTSGKDLFALRVRGDSMSEAGILHEDLVIVRRQATADSGQTVVALVGEEATVKTLWVPDLSTGPEAQRPVFVELRPQNPNFQVLRIRHDELKILGKVVEVRRYIETQFLPLLGPEDFPS